MEYYGFAAMNFQSFGGDKGDWVYNRIIPIKCDYVIEEKDQDKNLVEHLLEEAEYIVSLAVKGLKQVIQNGYKYDIPKCCEDLKKDYKISNNSFLVFMKECVIMRPTKYVEDDCTVKVFYDIYRDWCKDNNGGYAESKSEVHKILCNMGLGDKIKTKGGYYFYRKITINRETMTSYSKAYGSIIKEDKYEDEPYDEEDKREKEYWNKVNEETKMLDSFNNYMDTIFHFDTSGLEDLEI